MEIPADLVLNLLNERAQSDPLIREILRSTMYEAALKLRTQEPEEEPKETKKEK